MTGCLGRTPLPSTLQKPALDTSMTGALSVTPAYLSLVCSETRDQSLSRLTPGWCRLELLGVHVEVPHSHLSEVTRMVFVKVNPVVMLTTSVSATSRVLPVLSDPAVTM